MKGKVFDQNPKTQVARGNPWYVDDQFQIVSSRISYAYVTNERKKMVRSLLSSLIASTSKKSFSVLDAGCGDGIWIDFVGRIFDQSGRHASLCALDYNYLRANRARRLPSLPPVLEASVVHLPFPSGIFDVTLCIHVLEHIVDPRQALDEIARVTTPAGAVLIGVPNEGCALARLRNRLLEAGTTKRTDHVNFFTVPLFLELLDRTCLRPVSILRSGFFIPHQAVHRLLLQRFPGRLLVRLFARIFPSEAAEFVVLCTASK